MNYATTLILLALSCAALGTFYGGVAAVLLDWMAMNFLSLGIAHACKAHGLFGKHAGGSLPWWSWVVFLPLHILNHGVWHLFRVVAKEPASNVVSERLTIGRRLLPHESPDAFANYVDLTAEFSEPQSLREMSGYIALPILDASAPSPDHLRTTINHLRPGKTFVHCAQGHGRTGLFALAYLLSNGDAQTVEEGLALLTTARPAVHLNRTQMHCARAFAASLQTPVDKLRVIPLL